MKNIPMVIFCLIMSLYQNLNHALSNDSFLSKWAYLHPPLQVQEYYEQQEEHDEDMKHKWNYLIAK